jgi:hypothetical protein
MPGWPVSPDRDRQTARIGDRAAVMDPTAAGLGFAACLVGYALRRGGKLTEEKAYRALRPWSLGSRVWIECEASTGAASLAGVRFSLVRGPGGRRAGRR